MDIFPPAQLQYHERVNMLEAEAARYIEPIGFLLGIEREVGMERALPGMNAVSAPESRDMLEEARADAATMVRGLRPATDHQAERQERWLSQIDTFGLKDAVNFRLYQEFSTATLADPGVTAGLSYDQLVALSAEKGWLEFRFGTGMYQDGYYDNYSVGETRVYPAPPAEAIRRSNIIRGRMARLAFQYGIRLVPMGIHPNISAHRQNGDGSSQPLIGSARLHEEDTLDTTAGLAAAFADGAWLGRGNRTISDGFVGRRSMTLSARDRFGLNLRPDYVELHSPLLADNIALGAAWTMAGMLYGLDRGSESIAADGYEVPRVNDDFLVVPETSYVKDGQLHILRALNQSTLNADGSFVLDTTYNNMRTSQLSAELIGDNGETNMFAGAFFSALAGPDAYKEVFGSGITDPNIILPNKADVGRKAFNAWAVNATHADVSGALSCTPETLLTSYQRLKTEDQERVKPVVGEPHITALAKIIARQLASMRVERQPLINGRYEFAGGPIAEVRRRMVASGVVNLAFGDRLDEHLRYCGLEA